MWVTDFFKWKNSDSFLNLTYLVAYVTSEDRDKEGLKEESSEELTFMSKLALLLSVLSSCCFFLKKTFPQAIFYYK